MPLEQIRNLCCRLEGQWGPVTTPPGKDNTKTAPTYIANTAPTNAGNAATVRVPGPPLQDNVSWLHHSGWASRLNNISWLYGHWAPRARAPVATSRPVESSGANKRAVADPMESKAPAEPLAGNKASVCMAELFGESDALPESPRVEAFNLALATRPMGEDARVSNRAACPFGEFEPPLQVEGVATALNVTLVTAMKERDISFESPACPDKLHSAASCAAPATPTKPVPPPKPLALMNRPKAGIRPAAPLLAASRDISRAGGKVAGLSARDRAMADALFKALSLRAPDEDVDEFYARVGKATCAPEFRGDADSGGAGTAVVPKTANESSRTLRLPSDLLAAIRDVKRQTPATAAPGLSSHPVTKVRREDTIEKALKRVFAEKDNAAVWRQDSHDSGVASHDETSTGDWD